MARTYTEQSTAAACVMDLYAAARRERRFRQLMAERAVTPAAEQQAA